VFSKVLKSSGWWGAYDAEAWISNNSTACFLVEWLFGRTTRAPAAQMLI